MRDVQSGCSCPKCQQARARGSREDALDARSQDDARCSCPQCRQADAYAAQEDDACDCRHGGPKSPDSGGSAARSDRDFGDAEDLDADDFDDDELDDEERSAANRGARFGRDFGDVEDANEFDFRDDDELDDDDLDAQDAQDAEADMEADDAEETDDLDFHDDDELDDDDLDTEQELQDELDDDDLDDGEEPRYPASTKGCACAKCRRADAPRSRDAVRPAADTDDLDAENAEPDFESDDDADGADMNRVGIDSSDGRGWHWMSNDLDGDDDLIRADASGDDLVDEYDDEDALEDLMDEWDAEDDLADDDEDDDWRPAGAFEEAWDVGQFPRARPRNDESLREARGELDFVEAPWKKPDHDKSVLTWNQLPGCHAIQQLEIWKGEEGNPNHLADWVYISRLCEAVNRARDWLSEMRSEINAIYRGRGIDISRAWNRHPSFPYWFGWGLRTKQQIWAVRRGILRMRGWFDESVGARGLRFAVVKEESGTNRHLCTGHNSAYTLSPVVHLCPSFFEDNDLATRLWRAEIIVHELAHRLFQRPAAATALGLWPGAQLGAWNTGPGIVIATTHPVVKLAGSGALRSPTNQGNRSRQIARILAHRRPLAARRSPVNWAILARELGHDRQINVNDVRHPI